MNDIDSYLQRGSVYARRGLGDCRILDTLSDFEFYRLVVWQNVRWFASDHLEPFLEAGFPNLWTYYCCVPGGGCEQSFLPCLPQKPHF